MTVNITFESGLEQLEALIARMEAGDMPLEESFEAYKRGVELFKRLENMLNEGDARIRELTNAGEKDITDEVVGE